MAGVLQKHTQVFREELGTLKVFAAKIHVDVGKPPKFFKARPVPYAMRTKVEQELDRLVQTNVMEPVRYSDWATPIVPVLKADGKVRVCGDYKLTVNRVSHLEEYTHSLDDLCEKLTGGKQFSKLDLSHAYSQLPLDNKSKEYATVNTHKGLFRYNRLPYGISSAPAIFQRTWVTRLTNMDCIQ